MAEVAARGREKNREGVVLSLGDSLTYANPSTRGRATRWAAYPGSCGAEVVPRRKRGRLGWMASGLGGRGAQAAPKRGLRIRTDEFIAGGKAGLPPLEGLIAKYKPQVAFVLLGANDASAGRTPEEVARDMATILDVPPGQWNDSVLKLLAPVPTPDATSFPANTTGGFWNRPRAEAAVIDFTANSRRGPPGMPGKPVAARRRVHFTMSCRADRPRRRIGAVRLPPALLAVGAKTQGGQGEGVGPGEVARIPSSPRSRCRWRCR